MKTCPECGKPIGYGVDYCKSCGAEIDTTNTSNIPNNTNEIEDTRDGRTKICSRCHNTNTYNAPFCKYCGGKFYSPYQLPSSNPLSNNTNCNSSSTPNNNNSATAVTEQSPQVASSPQNNSQPYNSNYSNNSNQSAFNNIKDEVFNELAKTSPWITSLRTVFKIVFWLLLILSFILGIYLGDAQDSAFFGLIIIVLGVIIDLLIVGFQLVFLDLAEDIRTIKVLLSNKVKK